MKIIKNESLIKRNRTIGNWTSLAGIALVAIPIYFYTQALLQGNIEGMNMTAFLLLSLAGLLVSQVGMYLGSRFGRSPRPDERLDSGLKGLQNEFVLYHYTTPVSHLLLGPAGIWIIRPYHQQGKIIYKKNRWQISGGGFAQSYLRIFGQEGLGRPDIETENDIKALKKHLLKHMDESEIPEVNALIVFTNDNVEVNAEGSPVPAMKLKQLKDFVRQKAREKKLPAGTLNKLKTVLE